MKTLVAREDYKQKETKKIDKSRISNKSRVAISKQNK